MDFRLILSLFAATALMSCAPFRDSPFSDTLMRDDRNLNVVNMARIANIEEDGAIRIAILSDSHGNYEDLDLAIAQINATSRIDFAVHLGDLTNSSYNYEYDQFLAGYARLRPPRLTLIGNHDALGAGPSLFAKAFGPANYCFESQHVRFIFWHSVGMEDPDGFSVQWLANAVENSTKAVVIFSHVPLDDDERFHGAIRDQLIAVRDNEKVQAVLNGHNHEFALSASTHGTHLMTSPRVEFGEWVLFEIKVDGLHIQPSAAKDAIWVSFKNLPLH
ncbi:MAG: metallophosphoesterase [Bdellovibrionales bacterium]